MKLSELDNGKSALIREVKGNDDLSRQIKEMGFVPGSTVRVHSRGPFGSPIVVELRGATIAMRKNEAERVEL